MRERREERRKRQKRMRFKQVACRLVDGGHENASSSSHFSAANGWKSGDLQWLQD
jgi:hypothetical protein